MNNVETKHKVVIDRKNKSAKDQDVRHDDQVQWVPDEPCTWAVDFNKNGTPFNGTHFDNANPEGTVDGSCPKKKYDYTLTVDGVEKDPAIIVK